MKRLLVALLAMAGAYPTIGEAYAQNATDIETFEAFKALCSPDLLDVEAAKARALAYGWEFADESASPRLAARGSFARWMQRFGADESHNHLFKLKFGARTIFGQMNGTASNGVHFCYVYDFDAQSPSLGALVRTWLEAEPTKVHRDPRHLMEQWYRPGKLAQFLRVQSNFAASTPSGEKLGSVGAELSTSQVEPSRDTF